MRMGSRSWRKEASAAHTATVVLSETPVSSLISLVNPGQRTPESILPRGRGWRLARPITTLARPWPRPLCSFASRHAQPCLPVP